MTTYNTGNAIGSTDPRDLYDNAENLDSAVNDLASPTWVDRFGVTRTTLAGQIGYIGTGAGGAIESYTSGLELTTFSTIIEYNGEFYRPSASATLPYTTTATLPDVDSNLVAVGDAVLRQDLASSLSGSGAALVSMEDGPTVEAFLGLQRTRPIESYGGIPNDNSAGAMSANEAALVAAEADSYQPFLGAGNSYYVSSGYDVWQHRFAAGRGVTLFIDATSYDVSNAVWGIYRIDDFNSGTNDYITLRNARDDIVIARIARGDNSSASHVFQLPIDVRRDSHSLISAPTSVGGTSDILFRNSDNEDLFYINNQTNANLLRFNINTQVAPSFSFDSAIDIPTETSTDPVTFPALPVKFEKGVRFKKRSTGVIEFEILPGDDVHTLQDRTSGNELGSISKDYFSFAGQKFHSLSSIPAARVSFEYSDSLLDSFPKTTTIKSANASRESWTATLKAVGQPSGGGGGQKETRYFWDGSTLTATDIVNTLDPQVVAQVQENGTTAGELELFLDYTGGLGGGCAIEVHLSVVGTAR